MNDIYEVRCFCRRRPLVAVCGRDTATGEPFVHVKALKHGQVHTEVIVHSGVVRVRCRECQRWQTIRVVDLRVPRVTAEGPPATVLV